MNSEINQIETETNLAVGEHFIMDAWGVSRERLNDPETIREALMKAIAAVKATLINLTVHQFSPHGVTATATLAESHIALHTWPEHGYFGMDIFLCSGENPELACRALEKFFEPKHVKKRHFSRGLAIEKTQPNSSEA